MKKIRLTEQQLTFLTEAKTPGRVRIWNNSGYLKPGEKELVEMYPQYFLDFILEKDIEELEKSEDSDKIYNMACSIRRASNKDEKNRLKAEMSNFLINHELYSIYLHRFVQDYIIPNRDRQIYVDKLKNRQRVTDDEREKYDHINVYNSIYPSLNGFKDFLIP